MTNTDSKLVKSQTRTFGPVPIAGYGKGALIKATVRYDDQCGNGHNTFSITADVTTPRSLARRDIEAGGCLHDEVTKAFPELDPFIKWHLTSSDGPMYYIENTMYWLGRRTYRDNTNLENARKTACWPDMPEGYLLAGTLVSNATVEAALMERLPALLAEFRKAVESLGFTY